jgi:hypothetical protein
VTVAPGADAVTGVGVADASASGNARHLALVPALEAVPHDHLWALRDTEYDDSGLSLSRFECDCGSVRYR